MTDRRGPRKANPSRLYAFDWASDAEWQDYAQAQVNAELMRSAWLEIGRAVRSAVIEAKA